MKNDYPEANARLAEVAKSWAEGEVSWRGERRTRPSSRQGRCQGFANGMEENSVGSRRTAVIPLNGVS